MLPLALDLGCVPTILVGGGPAALKRLRLLDAAGAPGLLIFAPDPTPEMAEAAGARLRRRWPDAAEIAAARLVMVADVPLDQARAIAGAARAAGALVNVEDVLDLCDVHVPATVRRGDLVLAISTGGRSPGLARILKEHLDDRFGSEWAERLDALAEARLRWREEGKEPAAISRLTREMIRENGWLS